MDKQERKTVTIGLLGTTLDLGKHPDRWENWRPTVSLCRQPDLIIHRFELLHGKRDSSLANTVKNDIRTVSPETEVRMHEIEFGDPWDFEEVYETLFQFARGYAFDTEAEDYLVHITTGTHVAQICLFLLAEARYFPARLVQTSPAKKTGRAGSPGDYAIIDLDLSKYDRLASRFRKEQEH